MFAVTEYTAKELAALAAKLDIAGRSSMKKNELYAAVSERLDNCHAQALKMDQERSQALQVTKELARPIRVPYITAKQLCTLTGWKRLPRMYKKMARKQGLLV